MPLLNLFFNIVVLTVVYKAASSLVRKKLLATLTAVNDIPLLGNPRKDGDKIGGTAVICGGSIAGLFTARVCSDHFKHVVIVEPEEWVTKSEVTGDEKSSPVSQKRARVSQYTTFHGYQSFITLVLRRLFPNYDVELAKAGARCVLQDGRLHWAGVPIIAPRHQYTSTTFPVAPNITRAGFETVLRRLVLATCPNVRYISGAVTGLVMSESSSDVVHSVRIRSRDGEENTILATLVVDCTGPALGGFRWLQNLSSAPTTSARNGKSPSPLNDLKITYDPKMAYSTCIFDVPPALIPSLNTLGLPEEFETAGYLFLNFADPSMDCRNVIVAPKENNTLQFVCGGWDMRDQITSIDDIRNFLSEMKLARPLPEWLYRMLDFFEEERIPATYVHARCPASVYVQYHLADNIPSNFIAIGDSVLQLNPVRGQGTTKACVEAVTLNAMLTRCAPTHPASRRGSKCNNTASLPKDFSQKFFHVLTKRTGALWNTYKTEDYAWKTTTPAKGDDMERTGAWRRAYGSAVTRLMLKDREVAAVWWHTGEWLAPSTDMMSPTILLKLAWMQMRSYMGLL